jgi:trimeric autotransporter adhesin
MALYLNTEGSLNTAMGHNALYSNTIGHYNTALGAGALRANTTGIRNTATGFYALRSNTTGKQNTATGFEAMNNNDSGEDNTAMGYQALYLNTTGSSNVAIGRSALYSNIGRANIAMGPFALYANTVGSSNCGIGVNVLRYNTQGSGNTAIGENSLRDNSNGGFNTAVGAEALFKNTTGLQNTAVGMQAMSSNLAGSYNIAIGTNALQNNNVGSYNTVVGPFAGSLSISYNNTVALGYGAEPTGSNQVRIGNASVTSIGGAVAWSSFSDVRFKKDIKEDVSGLDFINQLKPVSYIVDQRAIDKFLGVQESVQTAVENKSVPVRQTGLLAQEVEKIIKKSGFVFSGIEVPQNDNDPYRIRYAEFVVPLIKAVQELTAKLEEQATAHQQEIETLKQHLGIADQVNGDDLKTAMGAALFQNNPNPFSEATEIKVSLPETTREAHVRVYNLEGKELKNIQVDKRGEASIKISANDLSAGMYLYALIVDGKVVDTKRLILTR